MSTILPFDFTCKRKLDKTVCAHKNLEYSPSDRIINCVDCGAGMSHWESFLHMSGAYNAAYVERDRIREIAKKDREAVVHTIAAKNLEDAFRKTKTVPSCPHCRRGLLPDDFKGRLATTGKAIEKARRKSEQVK